jgi:hypothetical protein
MTLNNLLSVPTKWTPIVPDRRHSMPSALQASLSTHPDAVQSSSALNTLVSNLRNREEVMIESHPSHSNTDLIAELRTRVDGLSSTLDPGDAHLAMILISLLAHLDRLSVIQSTSPSQGSAAGKSSWSWLESAMGTADVFDTLKQQLNDLQIERLSHLDISDHDSPTLAVEKALLWSQIDGELETVVLMCKERTEGLPRLSMADHLPPDYDATDYESDPLPAYHSGARSSAEDSKTRVLPLNTNTGLNEKMRLDLESVAMAIDRLYIVAPQLHNQRVELKSSKLEQMENARRIGSQSTSNFRSPAISRQRVDSAANELEGLFDLLGKATEREISAQSVILDGGMKSRLEQSRLRDIEKVTKLIAA